MVYMGSKRKYCKYIVPIIQKYIDEHNIVQFIDCFCGGANLADKINCQKVICNDLSPTLIALHKQAQKDFSKIPEEGSRECWDSAYAEWKQIREKIASNIPIVENEELPLYKIGAIEWYSSFSNGGFPAAMQNHVKEEIITKKVIVIIKSKPVMKNIKRLSLFAVATIK